MIQICGTLLSVELFYKREVCRDFGTGFVTQIMLPRYLDFSRLEHSNTNEMLSMHIYVSVLVL